jgi:hypothetical protein
MTAKFPVVSVCSLSLKPQALSLFPRPVPCPITDRDTPEEPCARRHPETAPQEEGTVGRRDHQRHQADTRNTRGVLFNARTPLSSGASGVLVVSLVVGLPSPVCAGRRDARVGRTGVRSTGRDSHDRLGGRVPPVFVASDAQTRRATGSPVTRRADDFQTKRRTGERDGEEEDPQMHTDAHR